MFRVLAVWLLWSMWAIKAQAQANTFASFTDHVTSRLQLEVLEGAPLGAATSSARAVSPLTLNLIKDFEKWEAAAYNDASMYCTVGYGHLIAKKPCAASFDELRRIGNPIDLKTGLVILDKDTFAARLAVQDLVKRKLSDEQFGALVSLVFNIGRQNFETSTLLQYLNNGEFSGAARQFPKWVKSKGVVLNGLITRRACEAALFLDKLPPHPEDEFVRSDCESSGAAPSVEGLIDIETGERRAL